MSQSPIPPHRLSSEERFNTITHLVGLCLVPCISWVIIWFGYVKSWQHAFGVTFFTVGMLLMYLASFLYHLWRPESKGKRVLRLLDHIGIYVLIASSYTPIAMNLVDGNDPVAGWVFFGVIWLIAVLGIFYKIFFWNKFPSLSLLLYIAMGWAIVFIASDVYQSCSALTLSFILAEGVCYTGGTYFFAADHKRFFHGIWHIFVMLGTLFHWAAVMTMTWPE